MATIHQIAANRRNAQRSTGPRTKRGKAIASQNAVRHGLYAASPVIRRLEDPGLWEQHRTATINSFAPRSPLEQTLAEYVAHILWRLGRVTRYEHHVTAISQDRAPDDLASRRSLVDILDTPSPDNPGPEHIKKCIAAARLRLRALTLFIQAQPDDPISATDGQAVFETIAAQYKGVDLDAFAVPGVIPDGVAMSDVKDWTAGRLHRVVAAIAAHHGHSSEQVLQYAQEDVHRWRNEARALARRLARQVKQLRQERILPSPPKLAQVVRYEAHLMRQLTQTLAHLKDQQHHRLTRPPSETTLPDVDSAETNPMSAPIPPSRPETPDHV